MVDFYQFFIALAIIQFSFLLIQVLWADRYKDLRRIIPFLVVVVITTCQLYALWYLDGPTPRWSYYFHTVHLLHPLTLFWISGRPMKPYVDWGMLAILEMITLASYITGYAWAIVETLALIFIIHFMIRLYPQDDAKSRFVWIILILSFVLSGVNMLFEQVGLFDYLAVDCFCKQVVIMWSTLCFYFTYRWVNISHRHKSLLDYTINAKTEEEWTEEDARLLQYVEEEMNDKKFYLRSHLTLAELSKQLGVSKNEISRVINRGHHQSFTDYINGLRFKELSRLSEVEFDRLSIEAIAMQIGFNSRVSMYNAAKRLYGCPPSELVRHPERIAHPVLV